MIIGAAVMLMAFVVGVYIVLGIIGWAILKFIFGLGQNHINWTRFPNLNGVLFVLALLGGWLVLSYFVGAVDLPRTWGFSSLTASADSWEQLFRGMTITGAAIIGLGLIALGIFIVVGIIGAILDWLFKQGR